MDGPVLGWRRKVVEVLVALLLGVACEQSPLDEKIHGGTDALGICQAPFLQDIAGERAITVASRGKKASDNFGSGKMRGFSGKGAPHGQAVDESHQRPQAFDPEPSLGGGLEQDAVGILHRDRLRANATP